MPQAAVSQQLARLRLDGLVTTRREGRNIYYALASAGGEDPDRHAARPILRARPRARPAASTDRHNP